MWVRERESEREREQIYAVHRRVLETVEVLECWAGGKHTTDLTMSVLMHQRTYTAASIRDTSDVPLGM